MTKLLPQKLLER